MNAVQQANDGLWGLIQTLYPATIRNPEGAQPTPPKGSDGLGLVVCQIDDRTPQTLRFMTGPFFDLQLETCIIFAYRGARELRDTAQMADLETLKIALMADPTLGGAVEYARLLAAMDADLDRTKWIGGGLEVPVKLLFSATSEAG